jgi:ubiquinol-cytochrome c reductase cytochrome b subunit
MKKPLLALVFALIPLVAFASSEESWPLDHVKMDVNDKASLQHGAQLFVNYCMGCHSLQYERYERLVTGVGVPEDMVDKYLKFDTSAKIGDLMRTAMPTAAAKQWFGAPPPDLTLVARARGTDWLYTYLRTFYSDPARPWGVNNKTFPDVAMPHVLLELQGLQVCEPGPVLADNGGFKQDPLTGKELLYGADGKPLNACGRLKVAVPGKLTPKEYDKAAYDLVNFLNYMAEPAQQTRKHLGVYVLAFLALLFVFAWLLNREYWKDVH